MNLSYPYLIADPRGSIVDSTGPAAELLGTDSEAIVGSQIEDLAATEDRADLEHLVTDPGWQPRTWRVGTFHAVRDGHLGQALDVQFGHVATSLGDRQFGALLDRHYKPS